MKIRIPLIYQHINGLGKEYNVRLCPHIQRKMNDMKDIFSIGIQAKCV